MKNTMHTIWARHVFRGGLWLGCAVVWFGLQACAGLPPTCVTDSECVEAKTVCRNNQCVTQTACSQDSDCTYKNEVCEALLCKVKDPIPPKKPPTTCPLQCNADADCTACREGRTFCVRGTCALKETAKTFERCGRSIGKVCDADLECSLGQKQYCLPRCSKDKASCAEGKGYCVLPKGQTGRGLCLPLGQAQKGKSCVLGYSGDPTLDRSALCAKGLYCAQGKCVEPVPVGPNERCGNERICKDNRTCSPLAGAGGLRYCLQSCSPQKSTCSQSEECKQNLFGTWVCTPRASAQKGSKCGPLSSPLTGDRLCIPGMDCLRLSTRTTRTCLPIVKACTQTACPEGTHCLPKGGGGICAPSCSDKGECPQGSTCVSVPLQTGAVRVCGVL